MGADLSFVTVGLSFTVAKGFSPLKRNAQSYCEVCCAARSIAGRTRYNFTPADSTQLLAQPERLKQPYTGELS